MRGLKRHKLFKVSHKVMTFSDDKSYYAKYHSSINNKPCLDQLRRSLTHQFRSPTNKNLFRREAQYWKFAYEGALKIYIYIFLILSNLDPHDVGI